MSKLPNEIRLQISRNTDKEKWEIQELLELIRKEIEAREATEHIKATTERVKPFSNFSSSGKSGDPATTSTLFTRRQENTHICRIKGCGGAGCPPPPIIFERLKLPQQIIYRRKENLSESPNHQKYWENILVSRFYEQFSRNRRNLGHFLKFEKISNS